MRRSLEKILYRYYYYSLSICNSIHHGIQNKTLKLLIFILLLPVIVFNRVVGAVSENLLYFKTKHKKEKDNNIRFDIDIAVVAIAKNEGKYIKEWLTYHKLIGVQKVLLYDNESTDNLEDIVKPYVDIGFVEYIKYPGIGMQFSAYNDAIMRYKNNIKYMAVIDCDEFLVPVGENEKLLPILEKLFEKHSAAGGIGVSWCVYGSSGQEKREAGLVTERFTHRGKQGEFPSVMYKTIINPRFVKKYVSPHFPVYKRGAYTVAPDGRRLYCMYNYDVCFDKIVCNHYFCKSKEEFIEKISRGLADKPGVFRDMSEFELYDKNDVEDKSMLKYTAAIKDNLL